MTELANDSKLAFAGFGRFGSEGDAAPGPRPRPGRRSTGTRPASSQSVRRGRASLRGSRRPTRCRPSFPCAPTRCRADRWPPRRPCSRRGPCSSRSRRRGSGGCSNAAGGPSELPNQPSLVMTTMALAPPCAALRTKSAWTCSKQMAGDHGRPEFHSGTVSPAEKPLCPSLTWFKAGKTSSKGSRSLKGTRRILS